MQPTVHPSPRALPPPTLIISTPSPSLSHLLIMAPSVPHEDHSHGGRRRLVSLRKCHITLLLSSLEDRRLHETVQVYPVIFHTYPIDFWLRFLIFFFLFSSCFWIFCVEQNRHKYTNIIAGVRWAGKIPVYSLSRMLPSHDTVSKPFANIGQS